MQHGAAALIVAFTAAPQYPRDTVAAGRLAALAEPSAGRPSSGVQIAVRALGADPLAAIKAAGIVAGRLLELGLLAVAFAPCCICGRRIQVVGLRRISCGSTSAAAGKRTAEQQHAGGTKTTDGRGARKASRRSHGTSAIGRSTARGQATFTLSSAGQRASRRQRGLTGG